jgi:hypothetical protein
MIYDKLKEIILRSFPEIVVSIDEPYGKLRIYLVDGSFLDVWLSYKIPKRYAYHWEHRHIDGKVHRHDNRPHESLKHIKTYPKHFHNETENNTQESYISEKPEEALIYFLNFIKEKIQKPKA